MIKTLFALLLTLALLLPTSASAQSTTAHRFYAIVDGNGNGYLDSAGNDICVTTTLRVKRVYNNPFGIFLVVPVTNNGVYFVTNTNQMLSCIHNSSMTYNLLSVEWYTISSDYYYPVKTFRTLGPTSTYSVKEYNTY